MFQKDKYIAARIAAGTCVNCSRARSSQRSTLYCDICLDNRKPAAAAWRARIRQEVFAAYGGNCQCCNEKRQEFLSIDHIFGDGYKDAGKTHRGGIGLYTQLKKLGWPKDRFRLLCHNCNQSRGFFGYCPHERENSGEGVKCL